MVSDSGVIESITNPRTRLSVTLEWPDRERSRAWLWQEISARTGDPWNGLGYAVAVEPSTRPTGDSEDSPRLAAGATKTFSTHLTISST